MAGKIFARQCVYMPSIGQPPPAVPGSALLTLMCCMPVVNTCLQSYCINREQFDFVLDVTKFKSKGEWAEDPMKGIDTKTKSAFTRTFNKQVRGRCWGPGSGFEVQSLGDWGCQMQCCEEDCASNALS
jgi:hypothetical protein